MSQQRTARHFTLDHAYLYCRNITRKNAKNFYLAFLFLPWPKRRSIYAVYAFCRYADDLVDDPDIRDRRSLLQRWRQDLEACYRGETKNHPILIALHHTVRTFKIPKQYFLELIDGMEMDLFKKRYRTFEELYQYAYRAASVVGLICIEIFGYRNQRAKEYAKNLGIALQLTNILRDVREDAQRGRIYLPLEDLQRFRLSEEDLLHGRYKPSFVQLMEYEAARAIFYYEEATRLIPPEDRTLLVTAEIMKNIYFQLLKEMRTHGYDVFRNTIQTSRLMKLFIAFKTWLTVHLRRK
jgi:phytoene synthase